MIVTVWPSSILTNTCISGLVGGEWLAGTLRGSSLPCQRVVTSAEGEGESDGGRVGGDSNTIVAAELMMQMLRAKEKLMTPPMRRSRISQAVRESLLILLIQRRMGCAWPLLMREAIML